MSRVSVVIPNLDGAPFLQPLLRDLNQQTQVPAEIIVVDNGSSDNSVNLAQGHGARVIRFGSNRGFAAAVNAGMHEASEETVAVLNNDLRLEQGWLEQAGECLKTPHSFVVGKILSLNEPDILDGTYDLICRGGTAWRAGSAYRDSALWSEKQVVQLAPFTAILARRSWFIGLGGLDERYGSYLEDVDFGLRSASSGHTGLYCPGAICRHAGSATWGRWSSATVKLLSRNQLFILARHYNTPTMLRLGWQIAVAEALWGMVAARHGQLPAWLQGKAEGLRRFRSVRNSRGTAGIEDVLRASEEQIRQLQASSGWPDTYWRWYFRLTL